MKGVGVGGEGWAASGASEDAYRAAQGASTASAAPDGELRSLAQAWVERTCAEQRLPVKVADPGVVAKVATFLREVSDAPDRVQARGVKPVQSAHARAHNDVVQDRRDDGAPLVKVEVGPLAAQMVGLADQAAD